jgi:fructose-1,6-bisphosphatase I
MSGTATRAGQTLAEHVAGLPAELGTVLAAVGRGGLALAGEVRRAALAGLTGLAGGTNVSGDTQKKLDLVGDEVMLEALGATGQVGAVVSEELGEAQPLPGSGRLVVCIDPLDGSSNTDINGAVGTIFGVYRRAGSGPLGPADLLRAGHEQVLAGYVMYGPSTVLVYTAGHGTHGFTVDPASGAFRLSHPGMRCPARGPYYSANLAREPEWAPGVRRFAASLTAPPPPGAGPPRSWSLRYTGALVADLHRGLIEGGIFFYPADKKNASGKLRLLYECAPLAFVTEQAGGAASTGRQRILDVRAESIHQRVPFVVGSAEDVALYERHAAD